MGCSSSTQVPVKGSPRDEPLAQTLAPPILAVSPAEERALGQLKLIFDAVDANKNEAVSKDELTVALDKDENLDALVKGAGFNPKYNLLTELDTTKEGYVSWDEFKANLKQHAVEKVYANGDAEAVESPADGRVSATDLPAHQRVVAHLRVMWESLGPNEDGAVSKDQLALKLKGDTDEHGQTMDEVFWRSVEEAGFNVNFRSCEHLANKDGLITWLDFEANLRSVATQEKLETRDILPIVEVREKDFDGCPQLCRLW